MLVVGSVVLRHRRLIAALALLGAIAGLATGLLTPRKYSASAIILPEAGEQGGATGLALAASQFGIEIPGGEEGWGPPIFVELLQSRALLETVAAETLTVAEDGGRRATVADLLDVEAPSAALRIAKTARVLREKVVGASEDKKLGAVRLHVRTKWPSVSLAIAERLVDDVHRFNLVTRQSRAMAERRFIEAQLAESRDSLRGAEDRLQAFLQRNRVLGNSPMLDFEHDRLEREVDLRQQMYTSLAGKLDESRIREVRNTPVVTLLESPRLPVMGDARGSVQKGLLGAFAGLALGLLVAFLKRGVGEARREPSEESEEFFLLVREATPRFLR
jgi:uncharacterized protein involved in exopolysaccharide biosynthesis